jgi:hypothetical protein
VSEPVTISKGDIVEVVMDVVRVTDHRGEWERVLVHGVFPNGGPYPPLAEGGTRNVVQVFFGRNMGGIPAFRIAAPPQRYRTVKNDASDQEDGELT